MMRLTVLASGSRGNSAVVASSRTRVLVDAGLSCRELFKRMQQAGEDPCGLDAILITHEHQDHVQGLSVAARKLGIPVYFTEATHRAWLRWMHPRKRMSYAEWLAARKAEAAARMIPSYAAAGSASEGTVTATVETGAPPAAGGPGRGSAGGPVRSAALPETVSSRGGAKAGPIAVLDGPQDDPFYRERELAECAAEEEELLTRMDCVSHDGLEAAHTASGGFPGGEPSTLKARLQAADPSALPAVEYFRAGAGFSIGDIEIMPFTIPHDAADPVGFVLKAEGIRIGIATDLGYMPANVSQHLRGCDIVMLESNHDLEMLRDGPYPWSVKQRVLSRVGHLSNAAAAEFLERGYDGQAVYVVLAHLSESNNMPELARVAAEFALRNRMSLLGNRLVLAGQHEPTESLCL